MQIKDTLLTVYLSYDYKYNFIFHGVDDWDVVSDRAVTDVAVRVVVVSVVYPVCVCTINVE